MTTTTKKITRTTIKSFINREMKNGNLFIKNESSFDGMVDCIMPIKGGFTRVEVSDSNNSYTLGVKGAWFVGQSRDHFTPYADDNFIGYEVYNCCGSFILAMARRDTLQMRDASNDEADSTYCRSCSHNSGENIGHYKCVKCGNNK